MRLRVGAVLMALLVTIPSVGYSMDKKGKLALGYFDSQAPLGVRYWFSPRLGADLGVGFEAIRYPLGMNTAAKVADKEGANSLWLEAGIPYVVYPTERANLFVRLGGVLGFPDDNLYSYNLGRGNDTITGHTSTYFSLKLTPGVEFWVTDNFSLEVAHGVEFLVLDPYKTSKVDASYRFGSTASSLTQIGFHFYFGREAKAAVEPPPPPVIVAPKVDTDADGVVDDFDKCPSTPKGALVDANGCPMDADKDGVLDGLDRCPNTPLGVVVDSRGCPIDADEDLVADSVDKCLGTPKGVVVDKDGCPVVKKITHKIVLHIKYKSGSFEPDQASKDSLKTVAEAMRAYPETKIEIRGYTDSLNTEAFNQKLSQNRAQGVVDYLTSLGVEPERMIAKGFGEDPAHAVGDNGTAAGRRMNRRVEIESVTQ